LKGQAVEINQPTQRPCYWSGCVGNGYALFEWLYLCRQDARHMMCSNRCCLHAANQNGTIFNGRQTICRRSMFSWL